MAERPSPDVSNTQLLRELDQHVSATASTLPAEDAALAHTLVSLLQRFDRLASVDSTVSTPHSLPHEYIQENADAKNYNAFDTLARQVSSLQIERSTSPPADGMLAPMAQVQSALLWSDIEQDLEAVLDICRPRAQQQPAESSTLPPEYSYCEEPPDYEGGPQAKDTGAEKRDPLASTTTLGEHSEKMRLDLENVTSAIDRLYAVCPQLHSQRVELRGDKRARMERARDSVGEQSAVRKGKSKMTGDDKDIKDLHQMFDLIGRASDRKLVDQSVVLDSTGMQSKLDKAKERDNQRVRILVLSPATYSQRYRNKCSSISSRNTRRHDAYTARTRRPEHARRARSEIPKRFSPCLSSCASRSHQPCSA